MSALPRPDLPPGAARELNEALHDLHHRAGWPSLRTLAREAGVSHTTVSKVFSNAALPSWGTVELPRRSHGRIHRGLPPALARRLDPNLPQRRPASRIAGRKAELTAVRRHLETGTGLLLVTGEAGIGKTKLVTTAVAQADTFVAVGRCLPLSTQDPLMPVIGLLREVHGHDDGQSLKEALANLHPFVREALARLLPELGSGAMVAVFEDAARQHVFAAVGSCLAELHSLGGIGLVLEDVHWADVATLDLLEHLVTGGAPVPLVVTFRTEDLDVSARHAEWLLRVRRLPSASAVELLPAVPRGNDGAVEPRGTWCPGPRPRETHPREVTGTSSIHRAPGRPLR